LSPPQNWRGDLLRASGFWPRQPAALTEIRTVETGDAARRHNAEARQIHIDVDLV
jgi:hypothetical protein